MMKKSLFIFCLILCEYLAFSQSTLDLNRNKVWRIGDRYLNGNYGNTVINFNSGSPQMSIGQVNCGFSQNSSGICDASGNEIIVTNGSMTLDKNFQQVMNCDTFPRGSYAASQGVNAKYFGTNIPQTTLILPQPSNDSIYYIFHTDANSRLFSSYQIYGNEIIPDMYRLVYGKLYCTIINTNRNNNLGEAVSNNTIVIDDSITTGLLTSCRHSNGRDWWILVPKVESNEFYTLLLSPSGIQNMGIQSVGNTVYHGLGGQAKFSPDGTKYARYEAIGSVLGNTTTGKGGYINLYNFDRSTGQLSNQKLIPIFLCALEGGLAFSPNSKYMYASIFSKIYQLDVTVTNIESTQTIIASSTSINMGTFNHTSTFRWMELGPDNKIYAVEGGNSSWIHIINQPDLQGINCDFVPLGLTSDKSFNPCLPHFPNFLLGSMAGISNIKPNEGSLSIYPNPATNAFTITNITLPTIIRLFDTLGKLVIEEQVESGATTIDTSNLTQGVYTLVAEEEKGSALYKVVITK